jgi:hypothetical protein
MPKITGEKTRSQNVLKLLLRGEPVTPEEFRVDFQKRGCENLFYKLSYYILDCKQKGAIIKSIRDWRRVVAYQLMNPKHFDADGNYISPDVYNQTKKELENANG